jgi:Fur family ferric uptake transcriptional regulator
MEDTDPKPETLPEDHDPSAIPDDGRSMTPSLPHVPMAQSPVDKFREFLELKKLKSTEERFRIVSHIFESHRHFDVEQLLESMRSKQIPATRATLYRTLNLLVEAGLLRRLAFGNVTAYEHDYGYPHHEHLFCERCGGVIEFVSDELDQLIENIARMKKFRLSARKLIINGICENCAKPKISRGKPDLI